MTDTGAVLMKALERSASEAMARGLDWDVARDLYLEAASVARKTWAVAAAGAAQHTQHHAGRTGSATTVGPVAAARMLWHAAVVASWNLDYVQAWQLARQGASLSLVLLRIVPALDVYVCLRTLVVPALACKRASRRALLLASLASKRARLRPVARLAWLSLRSTFAFVVWCCVRSRVRVSGVEEAMGTGSLKRVADAEVVMLLPEALRALEVLGRRWSEWAAEFLDKYVDAGE